MAEKQKENFIEAEITRLFAEQNREIFKEEIGQKIQDANKISSESIKASARGMKIRKDRTQILRIFTGKKWIITGKADPIIAYKSIQKVAEQAHAELISLDGGHMSYIEQHQKVKQYLQDFLEISSNPD